MQPGQIKQFGTIFSLGNYAFVNKNGNTDQYYGPSLGTFAYNSTSPFNVLPYASLSIQSPMTDSSNGTFTISYPSATYSDLDLNRTWVGLPVHLAISLTNGRPSFITFGRIQSGSFNIIRSWSSLSTVGISVASASPSVTAQSVVDPAGRANAIVLPASALEDIDYTDGETIFTDEILQLILDIITQYAVDGEVISSTYVDEPIDPPVPGDGTIAETQYTVLDHTLQEFKEFFGDIYDGLVDFQESFGEWVDDVAAGWTEVFGDIYDTLVGWQEAFGDFADTISSTVSDIADSLSDIVESIKRATSSLLMVFGKISKLLFCLSLTL